MEEKQLDIKAVELSLSRCMEEAIEGIFGDKPEAAMLYKMHALIEFADKLHIKDLTLSISLKSLRKAKKDYETEEVQQNEE